MLQGKHPTRNQPDDQPDDQPVDQPEDQPAGQPADQPAAQAAAQPFAQPEDQPADQPEDQPAGNNESPTGKPLFCPRWRLIRPISARYADGLSLLVWARILVSRFE